MWATEKTGSITLNKRRLRMRRYREFLWVSLAEKRIYLQEQKFCLLLYFLSYEDMENYIEMLIEKGYIVAENNEKAI